MAAAPGRLQGSGSAPPGPAAWADRTSSRPAASATRGRHGLARRCLPRTGEAWPAAVSPRHGGTVCALTRPQAGRPPGTPLLPARACSHPQPGCSLCRGVQRAVGPSWPWQASHPPPHSTAARLSPVTYPTGSTECPLCAREPAASARWATGPFSKTWAGPMWARFLPHRSLPSAYCVP